MIQAALRRQRLQRRTADDAAALARRLWRATDRGHLIASWQLLVPQLIAAVTGVQLAAAQTADEYATAALSAQRLDTASEGLLDPAAFAGFASDGWPLSTLLMLPAINTLRLLNGGMAQSRAFAAGQASLEMIAATQVTDAYRIADSVAAVSRRATTWIRVLGPSPCSRCIMLAGQSSWRTAFRRHPNCACGTLPSTRSRGREYATDPTTHFESMSREDQDRVFGAAGAQAIRDGADMNRVVNARRRAAGMRSASDYQRTRRGRRDTEWAGLTATEGTVTGRGRLRRRQTLAGDHFVTFEDPLRLPGGGLAPRLMPESIYEVATDHEHAIRLLRRHGYIEDRSAYRLESDGTYTRVR